MTWTRGDSGGLSIWRAQADRLIAQGRSTTPAARGAPHKQRGPCVVAALVSFPQIAHFPRPEISPNTPRTL